VIEARIHFFGPIRGLVRKKEQLVVLEEGATVRRLLDELGRANGAEFRRYLVLEGATVNPALVVFLNGESLDEILNLDAPLPSGAKVDVMLASPILGG
jgi:molybdopterin converting factor small subunit